jgi:hypothetical protein
MKITTDRQVIFCTETDYKHAYKFSMKDHLALKTMQNFKIKFSNTALIKSVHLLLQVVQKKIMFMMIMMFCMIFVNA